MFDWSDQLVIVAASGQSAARIAPFVPHDTGVRILAVNLTFRLFPHADALYAADGGFWQWYDDARRFPGVKIAPDKRALTYCKSLNIVEIPYLPGGARLDEMQFGPWGVIGCGGGNSGFQALNLAVQTGARRIALVGFDYCGPHWHADHPPALRNPSDQQFAKWRRHVDNAAASLVERGISVTNLSDISSLQGYPHVTPDRFFVDQGFAPLQTVSVR